LKNTEYVYGIVIYVGNDTKIMQNSKKPLRKISNMMKMMNNILYSVFAFQICLVLLFAGLSLAWTQGNAQDHDYLTLNPKVSFVTLVVQFFTYWVAYSHMIPISLYVIIELLKLGQASLIGKDVAMYWQEDNGFASCKNSDLIEEMGQVEFIFSDKTGTLTQNKMEFKRVSVGGRRYGRMGTQEEGMDSESVRDIQS
jgi:magnesium-transporting ATPase (P-type)